MSPSVHEIKDPIHARVFRVYLDYLEIKLHWTREKIDPFLAELGTSYDRISSDSTWYSLEFTDRFYELLSKKTNDPNLAFHAGTFIHSKNFSPMIRQLATAVIQVGTFYKILARFTSYFTRAASWKVNSVGNGEAEIESVAVIENGDRPYICENRRGILTGVPVLFGLPPAKVVEAQCQHSGAPSCKYIVTWQDQKSLVSATLIAATAILIGFCAWMYYGPYAGLPSGFTVILAGILWRKYKASEAQYSELLSQNQTLDESVKRIERKSHELNLIGKIAKLTHAMTSPAELGSQLVGNICEFLDYDRALLLMVDNSVHLLKVSAHCGFDPKLAELLNQTEFHIDAENTSGFFVRVVNTKAPVLISDVTESIHKLSARSQKFAKILGAASFVAVPIRDQFGSVQGVLAVDYTGHEKKMTIDDQDLLMTLADHLSIAMHNAKLLAELERNLNDVKSYSLQQQNLKLAFQKFVPSDLAQKVTSGTAAEIVKDLLHQVHKKEAAVLFGDMFNFSSITSTLEAEEVVDLINTTLGILEPVVRKFHGYVDKFNGDGFIAVFEEPEAALKSCYAAQDIIRSMVFVNRELKKKGYPEIAFGIGINYGSIIMGNIGSTERLNFTIMGEAVNFASRLESYTRNLGPNTICASPSIRHHVIDKVDEFDWREYRDVTLKGYSKTFTVYQISEIPNSNQNQIEKSKDPH